MKYNDNQMHSVDKSILKYAWENGYSYITYTQAIKKRYTFKWGSFYFFNTKKVEKDLPKLFSKRG